MPKPDAAHLQTDKELSKLEKIIAKVYKEAADDLQSTIDDYFAKFAKRDAKQRALLEAGEITEQEYKQWRLAQMGRGERFKALQSRVAERYTEANKTAVRYVNEATPGIYSLNRNYSAYTIEKAAGNVGFDLWDEQTVKRLIVDNPELMPYYPPEKALNRGIDLAYGKRQISASVTSSILQGKSIQGIAKDLQTRMPEMNKSSAVRTARTAVTGAQNAGRMDSYVAAEKMGIKVRKEWLATLDGRTRHSHAMLDGKVVDKEKKFENGCMFPGDPNGPPEETYNCRCTMIAAVDGVDTSDAKRRVRDHETGESVLIENMSYSEWAESKSVKNHVKEKPKKKNYQKSAEEVIENMYSARRNHFSLQNVSIEEWKKSGLFNGMVSLDGLDEKMGRAVSEQIETLSKKYFSSVQSIRVGDKKDFFGAKEFATTRQQTTTASSEIVFNPFKINNIERIGELSEKGWSVRIRPGDEERYVITHEFAHSILNLESIKEKNYVGYDTKLGQKAAKEIKDIFTKYESEVKDAQSALKKYELGYIMGDASAAEKYMEAKKVLTSMKISDYSMANADEFMAECFTQHEIGIGENKYAEEVVTVIKKYFGR